MSLNDDEYIALCLRYNTFAQTRGPVWRWRYGRTFRRIAERLWRDDDLSVQEKHVVDRRMREMFWILVLHGRSPRDIARRVPAEMWFYGTQNGTYLGVPSEGAEYGR